MFGKQLNGKCQMEKDKALAEKQKAG